MWPGPRRKAGCFLLLYVFTVLLLTCMGAQQLSLTEGSGRAGVGPFAAGGRDIFAKRYLIKAKIPACPIGMVGMTLANGLVSYAIRNCAQSRILSDQVRPLAMPAYWNINEINQKDSAWIGQFCVSDQYNALAG